MKNLKGDYDGKDGQCISSTNDDSEVVYPKDYDDDDIKIAKFMRKAFPTREEAEKALLHKKEAPNLAL